MENTEKKKMQIDFKVVAKLGLILFIISAVAATLLALTNYVTAGTIEDINEKANIEARQEVLPEASDFEAVDSEELNKIAKEIELEKPEELVEAFIGKNGSDPVGYTIKTAPGSGYDGTIEVLTGISVEGTLEGITILSHSETPGLGANSTLPKFRDQYQGLSAKEEVEVAKSAPSGNEIQAISGATITSEAVTDGVNISVETFKILAK